MLSNMNNNADNTVNADLIDSAKKMLRFINYSSTQSHPERASLFNKSRIPPESGNDNLCNCRSHVSPTQTSHPACCVHCRSLSSRSRASNLSVIACA